MGFWSRMLGIDSFDVAQRVLADPFEPFISTGGIPVADPGTPLEYWTKADVDEFWRSQPNVRKVVGFIARNVASTPLHTFERVSDTERRRVTDHPLARVVSNPQPGRGGFRFWESVLSDGLLHDRWAVLKKWDDAGTLQLVHVPSWRLRFRTDAFGVVTSAWFWTGDNRVPPADQWEELPLADLIFDHGYAPRTAGLSPIETLKDVLEETREAIAYRRQMWQNGGRAAQWIQRPMEAKWEPEQRNRFVNGLRAFKKGGQSEGGIMLLEDGMALHDSQMGASSDVLDLDGRTLSAVEVASAYFVAPELIGAREGNFSNIDAFRQMLYGPSLGPYITAWEQAINAQLTPDLSDGKPLYVEANIEGKLRGSFLEQAQIMQSATGAPWLTRNEARSLQNREPIEGADELVVPLNVLIGGQSSPRDGVTAGGGGSLRQLVDKPAEQVETIEAETTISGFTADEIVKLVGAAATLIRSGFAPEASLIAVGLDPVEHLGLLPVTVQKPQAVDNPDEDIEDALKAARTVRRKAARRRTVKARTGDTYEKKHLQVLVAFFERQARVIKSAVGAGGDWWDGERWDRELSGDLAALHMLTATAAGRDVLDQVGIDPDEYDEPRTVAFLREAARLSAETINTTTRADVAAAIAEADDDEDLDAADTVGHVFDVASESRAAQIAITAVTFASGFGTVEAAKQQTSRATKTWIVTSGNPRPSHAAMDGETVGIEDDFSNGLPWPGAMGGDADESAGCQCSTEINIP